MRLLPDPPHTTEPAPPVAHPEGSFCLRMNSFSRAWGPPRRRRQPPQRGGSAQGRTGMWRQEKQWGVRRERAKERLPGIGRYLPTLLPEGLAASPRGVSPPFPVLSSMGMKGTGFPNGAGDPARPPALGIPSLPAGRTPSPLFGEKKTKRQHLSQAVKEGSL